MNSGINVCLKVGINTPGWNCFKYDLHHINGMFCRLPVAGFVCRTGGRHNFTERAISFDIHASVRRNRTNSARGWKRLKGEEMA